MKYSVSPRETPRAELEGFPESSCYISPYIPPLVTIQTHSQSPNNGLLKYNGGIYPPRQSVFSSES